MMLRPWNQWLWLWTIMIWINVAVANRKCKIRSSPMHKGPGGGTGPLCVKDYDFENTNVQKVCILAQMQAAIHIRNNKEPQFEIALPSNPTTEGSYCNKNFKSVLQLNFNGDTVKMTFNRSYDDSAHESKVATYCSDCYYGKWYLREISFKIHRKGMVFSACTTPKQIELKAPTVLVGGITLRRSFVCSVDDLDNGLNIPMSVTKISNATDGRESHANNWTAEIRFVSVELQPFLVGKLSRKRNEYSFADPVLCKDVTASHIAVILIPLAYFALLIACYHFRAKYGCPLLPWRMKKSAAKNDDGADQQFLTRDLTSKDDSV